MTHCYLSVSVLNIEIYTLWGNATDRFRMRQRAIEVTIHYFLTTTPSVSIVTTRQQATGQIRDHILTYSHVNACNLYLSTQSTQL